MVLLPGTPSRAGILSSDILDLQVIDYGSGTRVVSVVGEVDALVAPELASFLTAQLIIATVVVVDLDGVRFLSSAGLRALFEANEFAVRECRDLLWCVTPKPRTGRWRPLGCGNASRLLTTCHPVPHLEHSAKLHLHSGDQYV